MHRSPDGDTPETLKTRPEYTGDEPAQTQDEPDSLPQLKMQQSCKLQIIIFNVP
jgi:hypothetical protein